MDNREMQRWAAVTAGALLATVGLRKGGRQGLFLSIAGGAVGLLGYLKGSARSSVISSPRPAHWQLPRERLVDDAKAFSRADRRGNDLVQEASEESFPASDAPAHTPTTSIGKHES